MVKTGSALFLLFFMLIAPIAPLITQLGSALFLFFVLFFSPQSRPAQIPAANLEPPPEVVIQELDANEFSKSCHYSIVSGNPQKQQSSQRNLHLLLPQNGVLPVALAWDLLRIKTPLPGWQDCPPDFITVWLKKCFLVRAGPEKIIS